MARYASSTRYGGQRASVGRTVVVAMAHGGAVVLRAGTVASILGDGETPEIQVGRDTLVALFAATMTAADAEALPAGSWTWPPRLT